jgi:hypothetical protein
MRVQRWLSFSAVGALALVGAVGCTSTGAMRDLDFTVAGTPYVGDINARMQIAADGTTTIARRGDPEEALVLPADVMTELRDKIDAADFPSLDHNYPSTAGDDYVYELTVRFENGSYTVMSTESSDSPRALQALEERLTDIARN